MLLNEVNTIWVGKFLYEPKWHVEKHFHPFYHIIYVADGHGFATVNSKNYTLRRDCLIFCPPGCEHKFSAHDKEYLKTIEIKFDLHNVEFKSALQNLSNLSTKNPYDMRTLFERIIDVTVKKEYMYKDFLAADIYTILLLLLKNQHSEQYRKNLSSKSLIIEDKEYKDIDFKKMFDYIYNNMETSITLQGISTHIGYNSAYLCRIFKERFGISPMQYVSNLRLEKAKSLIMYSDLNITQIAQMAGFQSIHYFSRFFKKREGIAPSEYKDKVRNTFWVDIKEH